MVKAPNKPLEKGFYDEFYTFINDKSNMNKVYNYFMNYENNSFNVGTGRAPITQYKQEIMYENFPAHIEMLYKKPYLFYGSLMTSTELFDKYKEFAKQNYRTQSLTITKFGLDMKKYLEPFVKRYKIRNMDSEVLHKNQTSKLLDKVLDSEKEIIISSERSPKKLECYKNSKVQMFEEFTKKTM